MTKLKIGDPCSHCKKGKMELHYSTGGIRLGEKSTPAIFWKCDNQECAHVLLCNEDELNII